jgi:hypothetical protein
VIQVLRTACSLGADAVRDGQASTRAHGRDRRVVQRGRSAATESMTYPTSSAVL